jgi:hypothetical protein
MSRIRARWLRRAAARSGVLVPSLVADSLVVPDEPMPEPHVQLDEQLELDLVKA